MNQKREDSRSISISVSGGGKFLRQSGGKERLQRNVVLMLYKSFIFFSRRLQVGSNQAESSALSFVKVAFRSQLRIAEVSGGTKRNPNIDLNCQKPFCLLSLLQDAVKKKKNQR